MDFFAYGQSPFRQYTLDQTLRKLHLVSLRAKKRHLLEPWLVEEALARLGDKRLSPDEQKVVVRATSRPRQVRWPDWWEVRE